MTTDRGNPYSEITAKIIAAIERDPGKPSLPWRPRGGMPLWMPVNVATGNGYSGINVVSLWATAEHAGYNAPLWATYKQWQALGAQVRGGQKSALIVKYGEFEVEPKEGDPLDDGKRLFIKRAHVFNVAQVDGYAMPEAPEPLGPIARIAAADAFIAATGARIEHGGESAFYRPSADVIRMPDEGLFVGTDSMTRDEGYYAVLLHELAHWTGHDRRLARKLRNRFGDAEYAAEELIAEIASAFLCADLQITQDTRPDHAQYVANWLQLLKNDPKAIFTAAAAAERAAKYLRGLQPSTMSKSERDATPTRQPSAATSLPPPNQHRAAA